jgi:hypothetical protein
VANSGISFPYLMFAASGGVLTGYNCTYDTMFVIGGDRTILFRGLYNDTLVRAAIDQGISELDPTPVETETWGGVKALYR